MRQQRFVKDRQYVKFCLYGFLKNLRFFEPFLVLFFLEKGLSYVEIGMLYAVREVSTNLLEIPTGFLSDALGRRRTMMVSFLFYIISFLTFYAFSSFWLFTSAMIFYAVGEAFRTGTHKAMIFDYLKNHGWSDQKVSYYGHTRSWSQMGSAVSSLLAAGIVFYAGDFRSVFLAAVLPYLLDFLLIASYPKSLDGPVQQLQKKKLSSQFRALLQTSLAAFKNRQIWLIANSLSLHSGYFKAIKDYLQPILQTFALSLPFFLFFEEQKRSALVIGIVYFFIYLSTTFASRKSGRIAAYFANLQSPLNLTMIIGLGAGLCSGLASHFQLSGLAIAVFVFIYINENARKPIGVGHFADHVEEEILTVALSAQSQLSTMWGAIIAVGMGLLVDQLGVGLGLASVSFLLLLFSFIVQLNDDRALD